MADIGGLDQGEGLLHRQSLGKRLPGLGPVEKASGILCSHALGNEKAVQTPHRRQLAGDAGGSQLSTVQVADKAVEVRRIRLLSAEKLQVLIEVASVGGDGVDRKPSFGGKGK
jgi:hypothetical protein